MKYDLLKLEAVENENFNALYFDILLNYGRSKGYISKIKEGNVVCNALHKIIFRLFHLFFAN